MEVKTWESNLINRSTGERITTYIYAKNLDQAYKRAMLKPIPDECKNWDGIIYKIYELPELPEWRYSNIHKKWIRGDDCCPFWRIKKGGICAALPHKGDRPCAAREDGTRCPVFDKGEK